MMNLMSNKYERPRRYDELNGRRAETNSLKSVSATRRRQKQNKLKIKDNKEQRYKII